MEETKLKELFKSGAMLTTDLLNGHQQMLMNEGTFIGIVSQLLKSVGKNEIKSTEQQLKQADVSGQVCIDCGKNKAKYCWDCLCSHVNG